MDIKFLIHNTHHENAKQFANRDPHLKRMNNQPFQYKSPLLKEFNTEIDGIYALSGGRQVGKTTLLKQWMLQLIGSGINPDSIIFFSGELIQTYHELFTIIQTTVANIDNNSKFFLLIDEITYINGWEKAIKYAADGGLLENVILMLTGSDLTMMKEAKMTFPGRRGKASKTDFHLYPLSFREFVNLTKPNLEENLQDEEYVKNNTDSLAPLLSLFEQYLMHGGYLTAINDLAKEKTILPATLQTYSDWIRGDILKRNKQEHYLRDIARAIIKNYGSQVTWNSLSKNLSIDHHKTISNYIELLQSMDAVSVQHALIEDKLTFAPKKAKKVIFNDPFIYHSIQSWLAPCSDPFEEHIKPMLSNAESCSKLVESVAASHYNRFFETYYIKSEGEVDIAYIDKEKFWPVEIKWTKQIRQKDLKQVSKYPNGLLLTKSLEFGQINNVKTIPLIWNLYCLGKKRTIYG